MLWCSFSTPKKFHQSAQFSCRNSLNNRNGFSIVEILVAVGIMSVIALGMATLITNQTMEIKGIDEKMALQSVQTRVANVLSSPAFCGCFLGTSRTFDYETARVWSSALTSIASSYDGACAAVGAAFLTVATPLDARLTPVGMSLQNIVETTASSGNFSANLVLQFDQTLLTKSRKSLSLPMYFSVNLLGGAAGARPLASCSSAAAAPIDLPTLCNQMNGYYNGTTCEPTYQ